MKIIIPSKQIYSKDLSISTNQTKTISLPINDIEQESKTKNFSELNISEFDTVDFPHDDLVSEYDLLNQSNYLVSNDSSKWAYISWCSLKPYYKKVTFKVKKTENNDSVFPATMTGNCNIKGTKNIYRYIQGSYRIEKTNNGASYDVERISSMTINLPQVYTTETISEIPGLQKADDLVDDLGDGNILIEQGASNSVNEVIISAITDPNDNEYYFVEAYILYALGVLKIAPDDGINLSHPEVFGGTFESRATLEEYVATSIDFQLLGECVTLKIDENTVTSTSGSEGTEVVLNSNKFIQGKYKTDYQSSVDQLFEKYKNGKTTATILCEIGEYYDTEGKKAISTKSEDKMIFEHYDEVVPMYRSPYGFDAPIVLSENNTPKTFLVLGSEIYFDGAVWQKLQLQEYGSVDIKDGTPSLTYEISEDKSYSICTGTTDYQIKDVDIATNFNGFAVKEISNSAFFNTKSIEKVNMPNTLVEIGDLAFSNLSNLSKINFSENLVSIGKSSFTGCGFTDINIPNSTVFIGESAFSSCKKMINLSLGKNIENIGKEAFYFCYYLTKINFNATAMNDLNENDCIFSNAGTSANGIDVFISKNVTQIPSYLFYSKETPNGLFSPPNIVTLQFESDSSCNKIGESAFKDCSKLNKIIIPEKITNIGNNAFENCTDVEEIIFNAIAMNDFGLDHRTFYNVGKNSNGIKVTIGKDVTRIPDYLFYCVDTYKEGISPNIVIIEFEEGGVCESIGDKAFADLQKLKSIEFSDSILSFDSVYSLGICPSLESITIPFVGVNKNEINASSHTVFGSLFLPTSHENSTQVTQYYSSNDSTTCYIPSSLNTVKILGGNLLYGAFYNCSMIENVVIGNDVNTIGERAFYDCSSLTSVTIGNSVTSIGSSAFRGCTSLEGGQLHISNIASWCNIDFDGIYSNPIFYTECIYLNGNLIKQLVIPNGVEIIKKLAFYYCKSLTSIIIPDSVTSIGYNSFGACSNISSVYYMGSETDWDNISIDSGNSYLTNATRYYYSETEPTVEGNYWHYVDGVVTIWGSENSVSTYSRMSAIPTHKHYTTDEGLAVDEYDYNAILYGYKGDKSQLVLPNYINYKQYQIGDYAFAENETIEAISIPYTVTYIGDFAFENCTNLKDVYYEGTRLQWNNIYIGNGNEALLNANIHFNSFIS